MFILTVIIVIVAMILAMELFTKSKDWYGILLCIYVGILIVFMLFKGE